MKKTCLAIGLIILISSLLSAACGAEPPEAALELVTEIPMAEAEEVEKIPTLPPTPTPTQTPEPTPTQEADDEEKPGKGKGKGRNNPFAPVSADKEWVSGNAYLDVSEVEVKNNKVSLKLAGNLPTPCHKLRVMISEPDEDNQIRIEVYSVANPDEMCIQVLAPFEAEIRLDSFDEGEYSVLVNGEQIGEFHSKETK